MAVSSQATIDESTLVAQAREGDTVAFGELVRRYEGKIFRLAQHITQNREDAEDVLQETFLKAYEHLDQFQGNSKFYTWIVRIAVNQALMKLRRRKAEWKPREAQYERGYVRLYQQHVTQADKGCDLDFLEGNAKTPEPVIY